MKRLPILIIVALVTLGLANNSFAGRYHRSHITTVHHSNLGHWDENTSFDLDDGSIIIIHESRNRGESIVEFTEDYELIIGGEKIHLNAAQQILVEQFYDQSMDILGYAIAIGWEGAEIGLDGAKLGIRAISCVFKLLSPYYDTDDLEREIEREAEKLEDKSERLEDKAEFIEDMVADLEDIAEDLQHEIPELDELGWF